ncbi:hypothetical protein [Herbaspirillum sp. YR522]|uniref:hypothetical protein n=1 Tax=Herbaspirillum sp. YR522 TaxID=1144342 RepID=UPI00026F8858|nr:hypothetical protein [Herbaspirillum sp. YR522]EJN03265.1 hypothetical protein PMI40_02814 [Herbaspirillum sp. YR522]
MSRLHIDFAPRGWRHAVADTRWPAWLMMGAGLLLCLFVAADVHSRWNVYQDGQQRVVRLQQSKVLLQVPRVPARRETVSVERANAVNQAISQLNLPWREVLDAMEQVAPGSVALLSMEPDAVKRTMKCVAEAQDGPAMLTYLEQLKKSEFFDSVVLLRHEVIERDPGKPIRFQFEAFWPVARP